MGRTTIISIVNTNVVVSCYVNIYHKNFHLGGLLKVIVLYCSVLLSFTHYLQAINQSLTLLPSIW